MQPPLWQPPLIVHLNKTGRNGSRKLLYSLADGDLSKRYSLEIGHYFKIISCFFQQSKAIREAVAPTPAPPSQAAAHLSVVAQGRGFIIEW